MNRFCAGPQVNNNDRAVDLIVVPSNPAAIATTWKSPASEHPWMYQLSQDLPRVQVWWYQYRVVNEKTNSNRDYYNEAKEFVAALGAMPSAPNGTRVPTVFVAHSLGGAMLKIALWEAYQQGQQFASLFALTKGIVLLSVPHETESDLKATNKVAYQHAKQRLHIPFCYEKQLTIITFLKSSMDEPLQAGKAWESGMTLNCPVIVTFETVPTTVTWQSKGFFSTKQKTETMVLVDEGFAKFPNRMVRMLGMAKQHMDVVKLDPADQVYQEIRTMAAS